jgi:hypothetical protein
MAGDERTKLARIKDDIAELATRPRAVRLEEIDRIVNQLNLAGYKTNRRPITHGTLFRVEDQIFSATNHNPGSSQIKPKYVENFLEAMTALGLYGGGDDD